MVDETPLTDDYVAELLKKDARLLSSRGSGFLSNASSSSSGPKHKPNTRFLRNILRDTDAHNAALLAKEEEESRARLDALNPRRNRAPRRAEQAIYSVRDRHERSATDSRTSRHRDSHRHDRPRRRSRSPRRSHRDRPEEKRSRRSPSPRRSRSPRRSSRRRSRSRQRHGSASSSDSSFGPRRASVSPPMRSRGRGTPAATSGIDRRFDASYDPRDDVRPDAQDGDDWDSALEAARDRAAWRKAGAERLRAAGFTQEEVTAWEKGGKDEADVKWAKKGEGREWDRGKEVQD